MPSGYNDPDPNILKWDGGASIEPAITAQLLRIFDLLEEPFDPIAFDASIGRRKGEYDLSGRCHRRLLEGGVEVFHQTPHNVQGMADDIDYFRQVLRADGDSPKQIEAVTAVEHERMTRYIRAILRVEGEFAPQVGRLCYGTSWDDVRWFLGEGYIVKGARRGPAGSAEPFLVTKQISPTIYQIYCPTQGVSTKTVDVDFTRGMTRGLSGYRLP